VTLAILLLIAACTGETQDQGRVVRIYDGDSLIVHMADGREVEVRLFGIDAPERRQPWSRRSRQALSALVRNRQVRLAPVTEDSYGRTVAVMYTLTDGLDVNREMIRQGNAWVYRRYTRDPDLIALETAAREARLGLWGLPEAERVPPWQWRRQNRRGGRSENGD
jgi:endonuclease YncB( thermonuclease family)